MAGNPILYLDAQWKKGLRDDLNAKLQKFKFDKLNVEIGFDEKKFVSNMNKMIKQVQQMFTNMNKLNGQVNPAEEIVRGIRNAEPELDKLSKKMEAVQRKFSAIGSDRQTVESVNSLKEMAQRWEEVNKAAKAYEKVNATKGDIEAFKAKVKELDNTISATSKLATENEKLIKTQDRLRDAQEKQQSREEEAIRLIDLKREALNRWYRMLSSGDQDVLASQFKELNRELDRMEASGSKNFSVYNALLGKAKTTQQDLHKAIVETNDALDKSAIVIDSIAKKVSYLFSFGAILASFKKLLSNAYTEVKAIDSAMVDLKKVTDETDLAYSRFLDNAAEKSTRLGATISDVVQITANWAKLGYGLADAQKLAESSIVYANVGDVNNVDDAVQHLTTTIKAFNMDANDSLLIVDKYNELSNKFAVTANGLGTAMKTAASALALGGNSLDESLAMITGITEITGNAAEAGNALRTVSLRVRAAKLDLEKIGEDTDGMITSTAKLRDEIFAITKFDITKSNGQLKSTFEIIQGIAKVWDKLDTNVQGALLEDLAGKNRANQLAALLSNWEQVERAVEASGNAAGSALEEQARYAESVEFKVNQIKAVLQDIYQNILSSDTVKAVLDIARELLNVVNAIVKSVGVLPSIFGVIGGYIGKNFGFSKDTFSGMGSSLKNTADLFMSGGINGSSYKGSVLSQQDIQLVAKYNKLIEQGVKDSKELEGIINKISNVTLKNEMSSLEGAKYSTEAFAKAEQVATIKTTLLDAAIGMLIGVGISLLIKGIEAVANALHHLSLEGQIEDLKELESEYQETSDKVDELKEKLKENQRVLKELNGTGFENTDRIKAIENENSELETQIRYYEALKELQRQEANDKFNKAYEKYLNDSPVLDPNGYQYAYLKQYGLDSDGNWNYNWNDYGEALKGAISDLRNQRLAVMESGDDPKKIQEDLEKIDKLLKPLLEDYREWIKVMEELYGSADGFDLSDNLNFKGLKDDISEAQNFLSDYVDELKSSEDSTEDATDKSSKLRKQLKSLANGFSKTTSETSALQKVLVRLKNGDTLEDIFDNDSELLNKLLTEFPELQRVIDDYADGVKGAFDVQEELQNRMYDFEADKIYDKFDNLKKIVKEYGAESYEAQGAMQELINSSPTLANALNTLGIKFDAATIASYDSSDAFIAAALAEAQVTLQSQQADLSRLQQELSNAAYIARNSQSDFAVATAQMIMMKNLSAMADTEAAIAKTQQQIKALSNLKVSAVKVNGTRSSSGSGSKGSSSGSGSKGKSSSSSSNKNTSIISETYKNEVDLDEYYIKLSEARQKRMNKDTDEYRQETAKQYAYYKKLAEKTYEEIQRLQKQGYDENNEEYRDLVEQYNNYLNDIYSTSEDIWESLNDEQQRQLKSEIEALEKRQESLDKVIEAYENEKDKIDDVIESYEKEKKAIDKQIDSLDEEIEGIQKKQDLIDKEIEKVEEQKDAEEERWEAREKSLDFEIERNNAILDLEKQRYNTIKSVKQEQANLDTQLKASQESYKYLDDETRQLLFNEDDYNELSSQLTQIAEEATQMYDDYLERLNNVTEETAYELEYITDEFERQYELKMKEYEIAKQELSVAKARKELENTSAERNVRMLVNGQWTWVADPNKVKTAVENVGKAEQAVAQSQDELEQTRVLQALQEANSELTLTKNQEEAESNQILRTLDAQIAEFERQIALLDEQINAIQLVIEGLEKQKDTLDEQIEQLEEQQDLIDKQIEKVEKQKDLIDKQIDNIESQIDTLKDLVYNFSEFSKSLENGSDAIAKAIDGIYSKQLSGAILGSFADGGTANFDGLAMLHGANGSETILNNNDAAKLYNFIHNSPNLYSDILDRINIPMANGSMYPTTNYGASTNVYVDGVKLNQADSDSIVEIFKRVIPIAR